MENAVYFGMMALCSFFLSILPSMMGTLVKSDQGGDWQIFVVLISVVGSYAAYPLYFKFFDPGL